MQLQHFAWQQGAIRFYTYRTVLEDKKDDDDDRTSASTLLTIHHALDASAVRAEVTLNRIAHFTEKAYLY
eukprot:4031156-Amphidinium_carterae.1